MSLLACISLAAVVACSGCSTGPGEPDDAELVVQVLPFEVRGQDEEDTGFVGRAFAVSLASGLAQAEGLRLLEVPGGLGLSTEVTAEGAGSPAEAAHRFVTGTLTRGEDGLDASLVLHDGGEEPSWALEVTGRKGDLSALASSLVPELVAALDRVYPDLYDYIGDVNGGPQMSASPLATHAVDSWRRGDVVELQAVWPELLERFPDDPAAHFLAVWALVYAWDAAPTGETLEGLRERLVALDRVDPSSPYDELMLGFVYRSSGEPDLARTLYSRVLARSDLASATRSWALRQRSITMLQLGNADAARADAEESVRLDPANASSLFSVSKALEATSQFDEAIVRSRQALALDPRAWRQHQRLGIVFSRAGRMEEAVRSLDQACELGRSQEACANLAVTLQKSDRGPEALRAARHARSLADTPFGAYNLACYSAVAGKKSEALEALRRPSELGFVDALITTDPDLDSLRGDSEFEAILLEIQEALRSRRQESMSAFPWQA